MRPQISLSPAAVREINDILSRGHTVEIAVRGGALVVWEMSSKKKYEVTLPRE